VANAGDDGFTGPMSGNSADHEYLARACWAFTLFTEVYRGGPMVAAMGPLGQLQGRRVSAAQLLDLVPSAALSQLAAFRSVFEASLIPQLASRHGRWYLGPVFTGSELMNADGDLIAAGLLIDLKTSAKKPSLGRAELFQVIRYALLDFDHAYQLTDLGIFSARYSHLTTWNLQALLDELADQPVNLRVTREEFRGSCSGTRTRGSERWRRVAAPESHGTRDQAPGPIRKPGPQRPVRATR
jgi:hypothetical protein